MSDHDHDHHDHHHHHDHDHSELSETELRVRALESILTEKGYVDPASLDLLIDLYEKKIGPRNGVRVVAKAWSDPAYRERLMKDATAAIAELDYSGRQGEHMVVVENTPEQHNMVVCTLCSCYPRALLGMPPTWYKSENYRRRVVREPRAVLKEFGTVLPESVAIRVHDSNADMRYVVVPMRPAGTEGWTEEQLASILTRDTLVGVALPRA
jgi:nitrile hydratase